MNIDVMGHNKILLVTKSIHISPKEDEANEYRWDISNELLVISFGSVNVSWFEWSTKNVILFFL